MRRQGWLLFFLSPLKNATGTSNVWIKIGPRMSFAEDFLAVEAASLSGRGESNF